MGNDIIEDLKFIYVIINEIFLLEYILENEVNNG